MRQLNERAYPNYRWVILVLLFVATTINYLDRVVLGVLAETIRSDLELNDVQYGYVLAAFRFTYAFGFLIVGRFIDLLGTKLSYLVAIVLWSASACLTGTSGSAVGLSSWRGALGLCESANFPAAIKSVSEWFPARQRSLATSLFNSGPSVALVAGPPVIAWIMLKTDDWRLTFVIVGAVGFLLVLVWPFLYRKPRHLADDRQADGRVKATIKWSRLLAHRETYGIMIGKFCTDPVWWFYIFWLPLFLHERHNFNIREIALAFPVIYCIAIVLGNVAGWAAGYLIGRGLHPRNARKLVMLACAALMPVSAMAVFASNPWTAILLVALANSAHNGWSANIFTLVGDCYKPGAVGSATGLAGFAGGVGGILIAAIGPGYVVEYFGYIPVFMMMGLLHPIAIVFVHLFIKKGEPIEVCP